MINPCMTNQIFPHLKYRSKVRICYEDTLHSARIEIGLKCYPSIIDAVLVEHAICSWQVLFYNSIFIINRIKASRFYWKDNRCWNYIKIQKWVRECWMPGNYVHEAVTFKESVKTAVIKYALHMRCSEYQCDLLAVWYDCTRLYSIHSEVGGPLNVVSLHYASEIESLHTVTLFYR